MKEKIRKDLIDEYDEFTSEMLDVGLGKTREDGKFNGWAFFLLMGFNCCVGWLSVFIGIAFWNDGNTFAAGISFAVAFITFIVFCAMLLFGKVLGVREE